MHVILWSMNTDPTQPRSFSGHVYDLAAHQAELAEIAARTKQYSNRPPALELVWVLPRDARPAIPRFELGAPVVLGAPLLPRLFDLPVVTADVDRPYLALRPARPSDGTDRTIRPGGLQAMAQYDWDRDGPHAGWPLP